MFDDDGNGEIGACEQLLLFIVVVAGPWLVQGKLTWGRGRADFREFLVSLWNYCTRDKLGLITCTGSCAMVSRVDVQQLFLLSACMGEQLPLTCMTLTVAVHCPWMKSNTW